MKTWAAWSQADLELLRWGYADSATSDVALALGRSLRSVQVMAHSLGLKKSVRRGSWSSADLAELRRTYPDGATKDVASALGRSCHAVQTMACKQGLIKSPEYLRKLAQAHAAVNGFKKGHVPASKGIKRPGWAPGRMREHQFRKGERSWKTMPIGAHRVIDRQVWRKVADHYNVPYTANWKAVHRIVWEAARGPVPAGHVLRFKEGMKTLDPDLITVDRLELLTLSQNLARNSIHRLPPEIKEVVHLRAVVVRAINKRAREERETHQEPTT